MSVKVWTCIRTEIRGVAKLEEKSRNITRKDGFKLLCRENPHNYGNNKSLITTTDNDKI